MDLQSLLTDTRYARKQLAPILTRHIEDPHDRVNRADDALERIESELVLELERWADIHPGVCTGCGHVLPTSEEHECE
jgi:hypothetical protein